MYIWFRQDHLKSQEHLTQGKRHLYSNPDEHCELKVVITRVLQLDGIQVGHLKPNMLHGENEANHKASYGSNSSDEA